MIGPFFNPIISLGQAKTDIQMNVTENQKLENTTLENDVDSWMPDRNLQNFIVQSLQLSDATQITKELLSESEFIFDESDNYFSSIQNFEGLQYSSSIDIINNGFSLFSGNNLSSCSELLSKTNLNIGGNIKTIFPDGIDFSILSEFQLVSFDPHNTFDNGLPIQLSENNYTHFFISYDDMGLLNFNSSFIDNTSDVYINTNDKLVSYIATPSEEGIDFSIDPSSDITYSDLSGKQFSNVSELFPDGPYTQILLTFPNQTISGYINICLSIEYTNAGDITIQYQDVEGNTIAPTIVKSGNIGDKYYSEKIDIDGYTFKEVSGTPIDEFYDYPQTITYIYSKNEFQSVQVLRTYNPNSGEHLYTTSQEEYDWITGLKWQAEGTAFQSVVSEYKSAIPVYRLYNPNSGEHLYTVSEEEYNNISDAGWTKEQVGFYMVPKDEGDAVYRVFNPNATGPGSHLFTSSKEESDWLINKGWVDEGIAFYSAK